MTVDAQCDPNNLLTEKNCEVSIPDGTSRVEKDTNPESKGHIGHIGHKPLITLKKSSKALSQSKVSSRLLLTNTGVGYGQASTQLLQP
jgi:hypothetical protein